MDHLCNNDNAATAVIFAILQVVYQQVAVIEFTRVGKLLQQNRFFSRFIVEQFDEVVMYVCVYSDFIVIVCLLVRSSGLCARSYWCLCFGLYG